MNDIAHGPLFEATRLMRAGNLTEATSLIQRTLSGAASPSRSADLTPAGNEAAAWMPKKLSGLLDRAIGGIRAPAGVDQAPERGNDPKTGARFLSGSFGNAAGTRPYKLYVPSGYHGQPVPLVVMLHGCTQSPDDFAAGTRMNEAAEAKTCLVLYPGQTGAAHAMKCWKWFEASEQRRDCGEPSLIADMTRAIMREYAVDADRVFAAGLSAGGAACATLAATYPDLFAAIGVHSGLAHGAACNTQAAMMAMRQGGAGRDIASVGSGPVIPAIVHPDNGEAVVTQLAADARLAARVESVTARGARPCTRTLHIDERGATVIEHWLVHGLGHAWAGGSTAGSYTDAAGPDATGEMLRFFLEQAPRTRSR
jgi:poly(hydroxyalkanoate) depolymerase family esterase